MAYDQVILWRHVYYLFLIFNCNLLLHDPQSLLKRQYILTINGLDRIGFYRFGSQKSYNKNNEPGFHLIIR